MKRETNIMGNLGEGVFIMHRGRRRVRRYKEIKIKVGGVGRYLGMIRIVKEKGSIG